MVRFVTWPDTCPPKKITTLARIFFQGLLPGQSTNRANEKNDYVQPAGDRIFIIFQPSIEVDPNGRAHNEKIDIF